MDPSSAKDRTTNNPDETVATVAGRRTTTQLDDVLTRTVGRLHPMRGAALALAVYIGLGVVLPVLLRPGRAGTIALGALGATWAVVVLLAALLAAQQAGHRRLLIEWTSDLRKLDPTEFEWLVGEVLRREGWSVVETGRRDRPDGNVDLRAERADNRMLVQCKRWASRPVGVDEVRKLAGTASGENPTDVVLVTLSDFTADAIAEAPRLHVQLVDGRALLDRIERVRRSEPCPRCETPMILDRSLRGWWLRCPRFPQCEGKRDLAHEPGASVDLLLQAS
jgi:HJR/Mrr/RecB family endonuclease